MRIDLDWTADSRDPLFLRAPIAPALPVARDDVGAILKGLDALGYYDAEAGGIPPRSASAVHDAIERFQADHGLARDGVMQPDGPTLRTLNRIFEARREEKFREEQDAAAAARTAAGRPSPIVLTGQNNAVVGPHPAADDVNFNDGNASSLYAQLRQQERRIPPAQRQPQRRGGLAPRPAPQRQAPERPAPARPPGLQAPADQRTPAPRQERYAPPDLFSPPPPSGPPEEAGWPPRRIFGQHPIGPAANDPKLLPSFADRISWAEGSSSYDTRSEPDENGDRALGRYQMRPSALVSAGVLGADGRSWTGPLARQFGLRSAEDFLRNSAAQEAALRAFLTAGQRQLHAYGLERYSGRVIDGVVGHIVISYAGMMAAVHRYGARATADYLAALEARSWRTRDRSLTSRERAIETRLRVFQNEQYSTD